MPQHAGPRLPRLPGLTPNLDSLIQRPDVLSYPTAYPESRPEYANARAVVMALGLNYDYGRMQGLLRNKPAGMGDEEYRELVRAAELGVSLQSREESRQVGARLATVGGEAVRQATFGLVSPDRLLEEAQAHLGPTEGALLRAGGALLGLGVAGYGTVRALGYVTKLPSAVSATLRIPDRVRTIITGAGTGAVLDAARPDGLPEDPASIDLPARIATPIANWLGDTETAQRVGLAIGGAGFGYLFGKAADAVGRGMQAVNEFRIAARLTPDDLTNIRSGLRAVGVEVGDTATPREIVRKFLENRTRIPQDERLAEEVAASLARGEYVVQSLYGGGALPASDDLHYLNALFRTNPGGMSVARNVTSFKSGQEVAERLGYELVMVRHGDDVMIARPEIRFPDIPIPSRLEGRIRRFEEYLTEVNQGRRSNDFVVLHNGKVARGQFDPQAVVRQFELTSPTIGGVVRDDVGVREGLRLITGTWDEAGQLTVTVPRTLTQQQVGFLTRSLTRVPSVRIAGFGATAPIELTSPIASQVEDALRQLIPSTERIYPKRLFEALRQFSKEGVFSGQAGVLPDGYPVEILHRYRLKGGEYRVRYKDPLTKRQYVVDENTLSILPTSLSGEFAPSALIMEALTDADKTAFARLRNGINLGLARPITTYRQLDKFAATRGFIASPLGGGQIALTHQATSQTMVYKNIKAAVKAVRAVGGPLPDLTPTQIDEVLGLGGRVNLGGIGGGGPPARFQETIPLGDDFFEQAIKSGDYSRGIGALEGFRKPERSIMLDIEARTGVPVGRTFMNVQTQLVHRQNFMAAWIDGRAPGLPEGVLPLRRIMDLAGRKANQEAITAYLESADDVARLSIQRTMTDGEIRAAGELRKWYDALFDHFGIEREYLQSYAPHIRLHSEGSVPDIVELWRRTRPGQLLPKGVEFFADHARVGNLDVYETRAFVAAAHYVGAGSYNRYMNEAIREARTLLKAIPDQVVSTHLRNYLEAVGGTEFASMKAAMDETVRSIFRNLGFSEKQVQNLGERTLLSLLGITYSAAMGFRPGLAIRNLTQILQTTWPMFGGFGDDVIAESIGRALSREGYEMAVRDAAVSVRATSRFAIEDIETAMPRWLATMSNAGMRMYNNADMLNRAVSYHAQRIRAERAIAVYSKDLARGMAPETARASLLRDSRAVVYDKPVVDEFLRRLASSPDDAAGFLGKNAADVTQFLYGKGNQPRWMRNVAGRFLGQFGTWPLWYMDYVARTTRNLARNQGTLAASQFLGKLALTNVAVLYAGYEVLDIDLGRWLGSQALFYSGGPAMEAVAAYQYLTRGLSELVSDPESDYGRAQLAQAGGIVERLGGLFIPNSYAIRDIMRVAGAADRGDPTGTLAALLGTVPTRDYTIQRKLDIITGGARSSTDIQREQDGDPSASAAELMEIGTGLGLVEAAPQIPRTPQGAAQRPTAPGGIAPQIPLFQFDLPSQRPIGGSPTERTALPEHIRRGESRPVP